MGVGAQVSYVQQQPQVQYVQQQPQMRAVTPPPQQQVSPATIYTVYVSIYSVVPTTYSTYAIQVRISTGVRAMHSRFFERPKPNNLYNRKSQS